MEVLLGGCGRRWDLLHELRASWLGPGLYEEQGTYDPGSIVHVHSG